jgi:hypothetical protein
MIELIGWLRYILTWEQISFISTFISAIVATIVWLSTLVQIREMRKATEEANRPYVVVYYDIIKSNMVNLVIENLGNSLAKNVKLKSDSSIPFPLNRPLSETKLFKKGILNLPPNKKISAFVGMFGDLKQQLQENVFCEFRIHVKYCGWKSEIYQEEYDISLEHHSELLRWNELTVHDLAKSFDKFARDYDNYNRKDKKYTEQKEQFLEYGRKLLGFGNPEDEKWAELENQFFCKPKE